MQLRACALTLAAGVVAAGAVVLCSGCGSSGQAANAQNPPPQTLSEPVRASEEQPTQAAPISREDAFTAQKGEEKDLPTFHPAATVAADNGSGKYHVLAKGETIYALGRMYNVPPKKIIEANNFKDANRLAVGTKVLIP